MGDNTGIFRDNQRNIVELLSNIEQLLAQQTGQDINQNVQKAETFTDAGPSGVRMMDSSRYIVLETANLDEAADDGTVTLSPGDEQAIIRYDLGTPIALTAIGAVDRDNCTYEIRINDQKTIGGQTNSPLGTLNAPFSFVQKLGAAVPAEKLEYVVTYDPNATGDIKLAGRAHMEVVG